MCSLIIIFMVLEAPLASSRSETFDHLSMLFIFTVWLVIQVWYIVRVCQFHRATAKQMQFKAIAEAMRQQKRTRLQMKMSSCRRSGGHLARGTQVEPILAPTVVKPGGAL